MLFEWTEYTKPFLCVRKLRHKKRKSTLTPMTQDRLVELAKHKFNTDTVDIDMLDLFLSLGN